MSNLDIRRERKGFAYMANLVEFPVIDLKATGENILRLRLERQLTIRELQVYFGFEEPTAIYRWQRGDNLPSLDNMVALSKLFGVAIEEILVLMSPETPGEKGMTQTKAYRYKHNKSLLFLMAA